MGKTTTSSPYFKGKLVELLQHHIIFGEIVVPGATYIEMAMAASEFQMGQHGKRWTIAQVTGSTTCGRSLKELQCVTTEKPCTEYVATARESLSIWLTGKFKRFDSERRFDSALADRYGGTERV